MIAARILPPGGQARASWLSQDEGPYWSFQAQSNALRQAKAVSSHQRPPGRPTNQHIDTQTDLVRAASTRTTVLPSSSVGGTALVSTRTSMSVPASTGDMRMLEVFVTAHGPPPPLSPGPRVRHARDDRTLGLSEEAQRSTLNRQMERGGSSSGHQPAVGSDGLACGSRRLKRWWNCPASDTNCDHRQCSALCPAGPYHLTPRTAVAGAGQLGRRWSTSACQSDRRSGVRPSQRGQATSCHSLEHGPTCAQQWTIKQASFLIAGGDELPATTACGPV